MTNASRSSGSNSRIVSAEDGRALFDQMTRTALGISADEFIARWRAGDYEFDESPEIDDLLALAPMALASAPP